MLLGCGGAAELTPPEAELTVEEPDAPAPFDACGATLTPAPELREVTRAAVDDWNQATGCGLEVGYRGVPLHLVDQVLSAEGAEMCSRMLRDKEGGVVVGIDAIEIARTCPGVRNVVKRELAHLFGVTSSELLPKTEAGLALIDEATLALVCETVTCTQFVPEVD